jgi:hypothetical protein
MQPARSLCGGLSNGIGEQAAVRQSYKAAHTQSIKKDTRSAGKAEGLPSRGAGGSPPFITHSFTHCRYIGDGGRGTGSDS